MTKSRVGKYLLSVLLVLAYVVTPIGVSAMEFKSSDQGKDIKIIEDVKDNLSVVGDMSVEIDADIKGDLYVAGGEVTVRGDVMGNIYIAGGQLLVEGDVEKAMFISGGNVEVRGEVGRNIYAAGGTIRIEGEIGEDAFVVGGQITMRSNINEDLFVSGGTVTIEGNIGQDLFASGGLLRIEGNVGQDLHATGGDLKISSDEIGRDVTIYTDVKDYKLDDSVKVGGEVDIQYSENHGSGSDFDLGWIIGPMFGIFGLVMWLLITFGMMLLGVMVVKWAPVKVSKSLTYLDDPKGWLVSTLYGFGAAVLVWFAALLLMFSIVGWPILTVLIGLAIAVFYVTFIISSIRVGQFVLKSGKYKDSLMWSMVVGLLIVQFLILVPILGAFVKFIVFFAGLGSLVKMKMDMVSETK